MRKSTVVTIGVVTAVVAMLGAFELAILLLFRGDFPSWSLLQYAGSALGLGLFTVFGEVLFSPISRILVGPDGAIEPLWKRFLRAVVVIALGSAILIALALWNYHGDMAA